MAALLGIGVVVSYFDRVILTAAAPAIKHDFQLDDLALGFLFGAFGWTYGALQVPAGLLLDRMGVRRVMVVSIVLWAGASLLAGMANGFVTMLAARALLGIAEAPAFPANAKAIGYWFPRSERSLAAALFDGAAKFSNVIALPAVAFITVHIGWREAFVATAIVSLGYVLIFNKIYHQPSDDPQLGPAERTYIAQGGAAVEGVSRVRGLGLLIYLLGFRKVWGLSLGFACYSYAFSFFILWLPAYFALEMKTDLVTSASVACIPWLFATAANLLVGGWLIDHLVVRGHDETAVRKSVIVVGMLAGMFVIGAAFTHSIYWALIWITLSLTGLAATSSVSWSLPSLIAPIGGAGTIGGIMNGMASVTGVCAPIFTGLIVWYARSFSGAFLLAGTVIAIGVFLFAVFMGTIAPIPGPQPRLLARRQGGWLRLPQLLYPQGGNI